MIDVHAHILPALDDGAKDWPVSEEMVRLAAAGGTTDIVATPHADLQFTFDPAVVEEKIAELARRCGPVPRIHPGCDFHLCYDNIQDALAHPTRYTINHRCYLLVEFSDLLIAHSMDDVFDRLRQAGMVPVITHPERNALLQRRLERLEEWVASGCAIQLTAQSFLGRFGTEARDFCRELMRRDLVHFIASDAHDCEDRLPRLDTAFEHVTRKYGRARAERLFVSNPRAALEGAPLDLEPVAESEPAPVRKWYKPW